MESGIRIRKPAFSGSFYPESPEELTFLLDKFFENTKRFVKGDIKALIVPHAGYIYSGQTAAFGFKQLKVGSGKHFILIGPSHHFSFNTLVLDNNNHWETPFGKVEHSIPKIKDREIIIDSQPHIQEHCLEVEIPFLQYLFKDFSISCLLTGYGIDIKKTTKCLLETFSGSTFIISSDLSHYLPHSLAEKTDKKTIEKILDLEEEYFLNEENVACGAIGIAILLEMAKTKKWKGELIKYDTSATASHDKSAVVGYASIAFH